MNRTPLIGGPMIDADEAKLRQLESLIAQAKETERQEAARKAEEERQRAEREAAKGSYTLADLEAAAATLREQIALRQHHLRADAEQEVLRRRDEALSAQEQILETQLANVRAEREAIRVKLGRVDSVGS